MTRFALFRDDSTGVINDGDGNTVNGVPDPTSEGDVLKVVSGVWAGAAPGGGGGGGGGIGASELIYRYTVTGSDKASIDTGVDTPDAGSNDWSNGDLLEVFIYARTDEGVVGSVVALTLNNDTGSHYARERVTGTGGTASASNAGSPLTTSFLIPAVPGSSVGSNAFGLACLAIPNFAGTVGAKALAGTSGFCDPSSAANDRAEAITGIWNDTSAVTRLAITPNTGGAKLKVGSQLLIYKRLAS